MKTFLFSTLLAVASAAAPGAAQKTTLFADDFERAAPGWTQQRSVGAALAIRTAKSKTGIMRDRALSLETKAWGQHTVASPVFKAPSAATTYAVDFQYRIDAAANATLHAELVDAVTGRRVFWMRVPSIRNRTMSYVKAPFEAFATSGSLRLRLYLSSAAGMRVSVDDLRVVRIDRGPRLDVEVRTSHTELTSHTPSPASSLHLFVCGLRRLPQAVVIPGFQGRLAIDPASIFAVVPSQVGSFKQSRVGLLRFRPTPTTSAFYLQALDFGRGSAVFGYDAALQQ